MDSSAIISSAFFAEADIAARLALCSDAALCTSAPYTVPPRYIGRSRSNTSQTDGSNSARALDFFSPRPRIFASTGNSCFITGCQTACDTSRV